MPIQIAGEHYFQIQEVARILGVSRQTLQRWFREGRAVDVSRDHRGWRVFNQSDVDRLRQIVERVSRPVQ
jgi:excisionase family DNA binding protein